MLADIKKFIVKHKYKIFAGVGLLALGCYMYNSVTDESQVKMSHFLKAVELQQVQEVIIEDSIIFFKSADSEWFSTIIGRYPLQKLYQLMIDKKANLSIKDPLFSKQLANASVASIFSLITLKYMMMELKKPDNTSSNVASAIVKNNQSFDDFYGGQTIKAKFKEIIDFLKNPQKYQKMGARIRRGVLFYGPPGTGKTLLARALANQAGCEFIKVVASQFQQMFVGVGAKRVRELFASARSCPGGCIIFIDEIDALGSRLNHLRDSHQTTSTINQFLSEMDGFSSLDRVVIVAATNRIDLVDYAVLRSGRFDIKVHIPLPSQQQRKGIFKKLLNIKCKSYEISEQIVNQVGEMSQSWCGADLENLINESIYKAIREKSNVLKETHVIESLMELKQSK